MRWLSCSLRMARRSAALGRSTKNISSNLPLRISSGGRAVTSLEVAATTPVPCAPASRREKLPSGVLRRRHRMRQLPVVHQQRSFSSSSIHNTAGAKFLRYLKEAFDMLFVSPMYLSKIAALSNFTVEFPRFRQWRARTCSCRIPAHPGAGRRAAVPGQSCGLNPSSFLASAPTSFSGFPANVGHRLRGIDEFQHPGAAQKVLLGFGDVCDHFRRKGVTGMMAWATALSASSSVRPRRLRATASIPAPSSLFLSERVRDMRQTFSPPRHAVA